MNLNLHELWLRILGYLTSEPWDVVIELSIIWVVIYLIVRFLKGTRGARAIKGMAVLLVLGALLFLVVGGDRLERLSFLYGNFLAIAAISMLIVFQPELRMALVRIGERRFFSGKQLAQSEVSEALTDAMLDLGRKKIGALIAIQRQVGLKGIVESGVPLDAIVSSSLLKTIFWPGSALHDLGVVILGDRIVAAGVQFPSTDTDDHSLDHELGSRHRAAIGLSMESDALVLVVSEETGQLSLAEHGTLHRDLNEKQLRKLLSQGLVNQKLDEAAHQEAAMLQSSAPEASPDASTKN